MAGKGPTHSPQQRGARPGWKLHPSEVAAESLDPLLGCLVGLTKIYGTPRSPESLVAGLPLEEGRLTPELFVRAASRVGFSARRTIRKLEDIPDMVLPAVLLLKGGSACILMRRQEDKAVLLVPETGDGMKVTGLEKLAAAYSGYAIFIRPQAKSQLLSPTRENDESEPKGGWFWGTLLKFWPTYAQVLVAALLINSFILASPLFIRNVYDRVVPNQAMDTLWVLAIGMVIVIFFELILQTLRSYFLDSAGKRADVLVSSRIFAQVLNLQMRAAPKSSGAFANRLREFESLRDFVTSATLVALIDLPFVFLFLFVIGLIGGPLAWIPTLAVPFVIISGILIQLPLRRVVQQSLDENAQKQGMVIETIGALDTVKSLCVEGRLQREWERSVAQAANTSLWVRLIAGFGVHISRLATQFVTLGIVVHGVYLIAAGELSVGGLIACTIIAGRAMAPLGQIAGLLSRFNQALAAYRGLHEVMSLPVDRAPERDYLSRRQLKGDIEFRNVTFTYPGARAPALRNVSFKIRAGEHVAFIGPVGSGKTTIGRLLNGLYLPDEGSILIDGTDVRQIDPADLRRSVGMVQQDIVLFRGTVKENIAMGAPFADDAMILAAAEMAGVHEFVRRHPLGYEMPVGEKGRELSGGQRQAIALARALLPDPPVFVMDEPTSMMDVNTERQFMDRSRELITDRTLLLITHRPSLFALVERIVVIKNGKVAMDAPRREVEALGMNAPPREGGGARPFPRPVSAAPPKVAAGGRSR